MKTLWIDPRVLVREGDRERLVGGRLELGRIERRVAGHHRDVGRGRRAGWGRRGRTCSATPGCVSRGKDPELEHRGPGKQEREDRDRRDRPARRGQVLEVARPIGLLDLDVLLAGVPEPAQERDDEGEDANEQHPAPEYEPEEEQGDTERGEHRTERRAGYVHAGRRPAVGPFRRDRAGLEVVVLAHALGAPVEEREDEGNDAEEERRTAGDEAEQQERHSDGAEDRGE